jgi:MFS transporter, DHA3 family, macrolide efflux protein
VHEVHPVQDLRDGIAYVRGRHELTVVLVLQLLQNLMISPFFVVYLVANKKWFGDLPQNLAWFEFSFFSGLVLASLFVGRLKIRKPGLSYIFGVVGVGVCVGVMGFVPNFWMFVLCNMLAGTCIPFLSIPVKTYLQLTVPDAFRGRVDSAWTTVSIGVQPIGMSLGGVLVDYAGLVGGFLTMGAGMMVSGTIGLLDRKFRRMTMPEPETEPREVGEPELAAEAC